MPRKNANIFECKICHFICSKQSNYDNHLVTSKHKKLTNSEKDNKNAKLFECILCSKQYFSRVGLWKHYKKCNIHKNIILNDTEINDNCGNHDKETNQVITKDMFMELINDNKEMMKIIKDQQEQIKCMIPKIGNTVNNTTNNNTMNNFNLNVFLNEHCKDALNISDFIDSLKITLEDLLFSKTNGISRGITDVMIKGLKELDIHKRPIHCTDIKRDIMYIKDEDKWCKDENHEMMKNTIVKIADKERTALQQWAIDNPDWMETERKQLDYLTMVRSICEPIENYDNYERKIIKNLGKEVQLTDIKK
jgi:hypothetical protein